MGICAGKETSANDQAHKAAVYKFHIFCRDLSKFKKLRSLKSLPPTLSLKRRADLDNSTHSDRN